MLPDFALSRPTTLETAVSEVAEGGLPFVGGTELVAAMHMGLLAPTRLVDLKGVHGMSEIDTSGSGLRVGATTRHRHVADSPAVRGQAPLLAQACSQVGNARVRATGSIGGNLCFADPRSDVATALFALDAEVTLVSSRGRRTLPVERFVMGAMDADCEEDEILESIDVPASGPRQIYVRHQPAEYPTACIAVIEGRDEPGAGAKLVIGAIGERPQVFTAPEVEQLDVDAIMREMDVIPDLNGSEEYKRHLAGVFARRAINQLLEGYDA